MINHFPVLDEEVRDLNKLLNEKLSEYLTSYPHQTSELLEAATYSVESPGHRWRPILFLKIYHKLSRTENNHNVLALACAIEYVHTASIILDDLPSMDDGTLRRGKKPCHLEFGQACAILTAHWLCDVAQHLIHEYLSAIGTKPAFDIENFLRITKNEMMKGQILDLARNELADDKIIEKYQLKSGALYAFAASVPAHILNLNEIAKTLKNFGDYLGIAYQISDDTHDCTDTSQDLGKDVNKDESKNTIPRMYGIRKAIELRDLYKKKSITEIEKLSDSFKDIVGLVENICL